MAANKNEKFLSVDSPIWAKVASVVMSEGFSLYDVSMPRQNLLRVFIDKKKEDVSKIGSGVTADDCIKVCRALMDTFAVEGGDLGVSSEPDLEVSSPGLDRLLRLDEHFNSGIGSKVKLWLQDEAVTGVIEDFKLDTIYFRGLDDSKAGSDKLGSGLVEIPFSSIRKAQRLY
jgi:ribosome maturation factor RimP